MRFPGRFLSPLALFLLLFTPARAQANDAVAWNQILLGCSVVAPATGPLPMTRVAAVVQAAVYDAVNGIERRFTPVFVDDEAPRGASARAAAIQAAYGIIVRFYPTCPGLAAAREASLDGVASGEAAEHSQAIARGVEWGQAVADAIWTWRSTDGSSNPLPAYVPLPVAAGNWQPPAAPAVPAGYPQFFNQTPWVITAAHLTPGGPGTFIPGPPPGVTSAQYIADLNEVYSVTNFTRTHPAADETVFSLFWNAGTASAYWDRLAGSLAEQQHLTLSETARLYALLNVAMADAALGCWKTKYTYNYWRPIQAIKFDDGNPATVLDMTWNTLFGTPAHPDYPSGHSCVSGSAGRVLANYFGDETPFDLASNTDPTVVRHYPSFSVALEEVKNARIYSGIHFRTATNVGQTLGIAVADYVIEHAFLPLDGNKTGQIRK